MCKRKKSIIIGVSIMMAIVLGLWVYNAYRDYQGCICYGVTSTPTTHEIDNHVFQEYSIDTHSGTFSLTIVTCPHHKNLMLRVFPDEGKYDIWLR